VHLVNDFQKGNNDVEIKTSFPIENNKNKANSINKLEIV
jgi:hypothetical protein